MLDLTAAAAEGLGDGAVEAFLGIAPGPTYDRIDPQRQIPLDVPVWAVPSRDDNHVPFSQSASYVAAAVAAGASAVLVEVVGDHFAVIDPTSAAWRATLGILDEIAAR